MIKSRYNSPYKNGKPFYTAYKSGVYLIKVYDQIVYVGYSGYNLYKTLYRHFQNWDSPQYRATYYKSDPNIKVRVLYCSPGQAKKLEKALILKYMPRDNQNKIYKYGFNKNEKKLIKNFDNEPLITNNDLPF